MKIIFLNTWHGKVEDAFVDFIKENIPSTDVFCFQESDDKVRDMLKDYLVDYQPIRGGKTTANTSYTESMYVKKDIEIVSSNMLFERVDEEGFGIYAEVTKDGTTIHIVNFHGEPVHDKLDTPETIKHSQEIAALLKDKEGLKVIGGDFNVSEKTKSVNLFEDIGYRDLIEEYEIPTTRNRLSWERFPSKMFFSDYVFTSPEVQVKSFVVPDIEISDHLPMIIEIALKG